MLQLQTFCASFLLVTNKWIFLFTYDYTGFLFCKCVRVYVCMLYIRVYAAKRDCQGGKQLMHMQSSTYFHICIHMYILAYICISTSPATCHNAVAHCIYAKRKWKINLATVYVLQAAPLRQTNSLECKTLRGMDWSMKIKRIENVSECINAQQA